jgi:oligoendopeptidase F
VSAPATRAPQRSEVPEAERWNAESVFSTPSAWEAAFELAQEKLKAAAGYAGTLGTDPESLAAWLEYEASLWADLGKLLVYASMDYSCDTQNPDKSARYDRARTLLSRARAQTAFAEPELLALGAETLRAWVAEAPLSTYAHYIERLLRRAPHTRSAEVEELLGAVGGPFATATAAHGVLANTDLAFPPVRDALGTPHDLTQSTIGDLLGSSDRTLRENAYRTYADAHLGVQNTMATTLAAGIKQNVFMADARRYPSALAAALHPEGIPEGVFYTLLDTFRAKLPVWHRYWRARARLLGLEALEPHDIFAPLSQDPPVVPFEQAVAWLGEALGPLGPEYVEVMTRGALSQRWVDRAPNVGKRMGAFSSGVQGTHPFIMMSYSDDVFGMSTLAHELGHSLHSYLAWQQQPPVYSDYSLFAAEVASNFNQAVLRDYLFKTQVRGARGFELALIDEAMANFHRYFFIMPTLARFELEIHERAARGDALSAPALNTLMADLFAEGYGDAVRFDRDRVGITWAQFHTHLYSRFYVFQYATGISGAHALAEPIVAGDQEAAARYLEFLGAGGSRDPLEALQRAGVDLSGPEPVEATFGVLEGLVARLEALAD